jgi:hypothetical protein
MKIVDKPILYRTITTVVRHNSKSYDIYIKEDINCTNYEIRKIDENGDVEEDEIGDEKLRKKIIDFLEYELEDFELFN